MKRGRWILEKAWFNKSVEETSKILKTNLEKGLSNKQVEEKQQKYGFNELKAKKKKSLFVKFLEEFKDFIIIILIIAAIISGIVGVIEG